MPEATQTDASTMDLDTARARVASLETELGTVTADRDGAVVQLADAARDLAALRDRLESARSPDRAMELLERLTVATEAQALLVLAGSLNGRDASEMRARAAAAVAAVGVR